VWPSIVLFKDTTIVSAHERRHNRAQNAITVALRIRCLSYHNQVGLSCVMHCSPQFIGDCLRGYTDSNCSPYSLLLVRSDHDLL
jgi:hypothetical protein